MIGYKVGHGKGAQKIRGMVVLSYTSGFPPDLVGHYSNILFSQNCLHLSIFCVIHVCSGVVVSLVSGGVAGCYGWACAKEDLAPARSSQVSLGRNCSL